LEDVHLNPIEKCLFYYSFSARFINSDARRSDEDETSFVRREVNPVS
jgi:hypothetical protein